MDSFASIGCMRFRALGGDDCVHWVHTPLYAPNGHDHVHWVHVIASIGCTHLRPLGAYPPSLGEARLKSPPSCLSCPLWLKTPRHRVRLKVNPLGVCPQVSASISC